MKNFDIARRADGLYMKLREVGRKISKANADKLKKAMQEMSDLLALVTEEPVSEAERSYSDRQNLLRKALKSRLESGAAEGEYVYCYIADVFDADFVYETRGTFWRAPYSIGEDGAVSIGTPVEVIPHMTYDPAPGQPMAATEAAIDGECTPLVEQSLQEAATANIKLIAPGWGSSGYYPAATLKNAASVFGKGVKMFWNHQTAAEEAARPEGDLSNLAGELVEDARWEEQGIAGPGLYARAKVFDAFKDSVKDLAAHIGVSIRASGYSKQGEAEGRKGPIIERIAAARSVDFVTVPGAGGQVLQLFESAGRRPAAETTHKEQPTMTDEQIKALVESAVTAAVKPFQEAASAHTTETARLREALALRDARDFAVKKLATITMPDATRARLVESLTPRAIIADGRLDEAAFGTLIEAEAKRELEYLQGIAGGTIRGMGCVPVQEAAEVKSDDVVAAFRSMGLSEAAAKYAAEGRAA
jgi:hypothetical protein